MKQILLFAVFVCFGASFSQVLAHGNQPPPSQSPVESCESSDPNVEIDLSCLEEQLKTTGLGGWVHASVNDQLLMVFTWRKPNNFFVNVQLPMASTDPEMMKKLAALNRHDQIVIKGEFFKNDAPIKHINVSELKIVKAYAGPMEQYEYDPELPKKIMNSTSLIGKVHIVANDGSVLVVETGDRVFPVFNDKPDLARNLYRNDKIELQYTVAISPKRPSHLEVNTFVPNPITVLEEIVEGHDQEIILSGPLVMFPQSPQIKFNVFALRQEDSDGVSRNFTIVNFQDFALFTKIREALQKSWDENLVSAQYDRNKYINRKIWVTVKGKKNVVDPTQANPQILPAAFDDVVIEIK